ncbi:MAG: SpoIID/LytB domain-containing protein [Sedimentisphaerales bacterium]|nr:SpoIID/LytB domain-containing protein [Sedimentisphaerales bacterium]
MKHEAKFAIPPAVGLLLLLTAGWGPISQAGINNHIGEPVIRVLLDKQISTASLKINSSYKLISRDSAEVFNAKKTKGTIQIKLSQNGINIGEQLFKTKCLLIEPRSNTPFAINKQSYRGSCELVINDDGKTMSIINNVALETYLAGVVSAEMPSYWDKEALRAQAIAARTYCLYIKSNFGKKRNWDVMATQANQVYKGIVAETLRTNDAVKSTDGMVLCCKQDSGTCEYFPAYYSSVCGGHTEDTKNIFGDSFSPLAGVPCPYCSETARLSLFFWPMAKFDKNYVTEQIIKRYPKLKDLEKIENIEPIKVNTYANGFKRIITVKLTGSSGKTGILRAEDLRLAIDPTGAKIQSTSCTISRSGDEFLFVSGRGFGHGAGLCQYGARQMAREGKKAQEILNYYYPHSRIKTLY